MNARHRWRHHLKDQRPQQQVYLIVNFINAPLLQKTREFVCISIDICIVCANEQEFTLVLTQLKWREFIFYKLILRQYNFFQSYTIFLVVIIPSASVAEISNNTCLPIFTASISETTSEPTMKPPPAITVSTI